jgi:hypothetical protein
MSDTTTYMFIALAFAVIVGAWLYMESRFKMKVTIKQVVSGRVLLKVHRAMSWTDDDKIEWWKITGEKDKAKRLLPLPPEEAIDIDVKGKKHASCYRLESGEVIWIKDDWQVKEVPKFEEIPEDIKAAVDLKKDNSDKKEIVDTWRKAQVTKWLLDNRVISSLKPITSNQRMSYFNNIRKAEARKKQDWKQNLPQIAALSGLVIIVLALIVMYGEIAKPVLEADKIAQNTQQMQLEIVTILKDIKTNQQTITDKVVGTNSNENVQD